MGLSAESWTAILTGLIVVVTLAVPFVVWTRKVDRSLVIYASLPEQLGKVEAAIMQSVKELKEQVQRHETEDKDEFHSLWNHLGQDKSELSRHGERLATVEEKVRTL